MNLRLNWSHLFCCIKIMPLTWISQDQHEVISFHWLQMYSFEYREHNQPLAPQKIVTTSKKVKRKQKKKRKIELISFKKYIFHNFCSRFCLIFFFWCWDLLKRKFLIYFESCIFFSFSVSELVFSLMLHLLNILQFE